ncbi:RDD family protein [Flagellimonas sp.]|uniref:RDD family protein n=1 Tax=Flagellimonas sp. TaxID=2058762 RepID=UPI003F4A219E
MNKHNPKEPYKNISNSDAWLNSIIDVLSSFLIAFITYLLARKVNQIEIHEYRVLIYAGTIILSNFAYYFVMEYCYLKTIGNFLTRTKVVMKNNTSPNEIDILIRTLGRFFPLAFAVNFFTDDKFHETISNTKVVYDI